MCRFIQYIVLYASFCAPYNLYSEVFYILVESTFFTLFLRVVFVLFLACILLGMNKIDGFFQND